MVNTFSANSGNPNRYGYYTQVVTMAIPLRYVYIKLSHAQSNVIIM